MPHQPYTCQASDSLLICAAVMSQNHQNSILALAIHCIDYRFVGIQRDFFAKLGLEKNHDLIAYPGASKNISKIKEAIEISIKLHNPERIIILDHIDCGAFGPEDSRENHIKSLKFAAENLNKEFPDRKVELFLTTFKGVDKI